MFTEHIFGGRTKNRGTTVLYTLRVSKTRAQGFPLHPPTRPDGRIGNPLTPFRGGDEGGM